MTVWNISCTTRHPKQCTCKILFVWHQSFIVKSSGQTSCKHRHTQTNKRTGWKHFRVTGHLCVNLPVTGEFPAQRPVTRSFDVFFDLRLNEWLSKQSWGWWFETSSRSLWCPSNVKFRLLPHTQFVKWFSGSYWSQVIFCYRHISLTHSELFIKMYMIILFYSVAICCNDHMIEIECIQMP